MEHSEQEFATALERFAERVQALKDEHMATNHPSLTPDKITVDPRGKKYVRIVTTRDGGKGQVMCWEFVERGTGNIYMSGGWKGPTTKHVRGNIFNANPTEGCTEFGPEYRR